jgi:imidazoleglycerol phosphate synthase glutamine amidotransferase subunit HisH
VVGSPAIVVVDYGVGNLASIGNILRKIGVTAFISSDPHALGSATGIILPRKLREGKLELLKARV